MLSPGINPFHRGGQPSTAVFWEAFRDCSFLFSSPCRPSASSTDSITAGREQPSRENDMCRGWMGCDPTGTAGAAGLLFSWRRWLPLSSASASAAQDCERHTLLVQLYSPAFVRKKWVWADKLFSLSFRRCRFWALLLTNSHLHCCTFSFLLFKRSYLCYCLATHFPATWWQRTHFAPSCLNFSISFICLLCLIRL